MHAQGCALENGTCISYLNPKIDTASEHLKTCIQATRLSILLWFALLEKKTQACCVRLCKGEDEFKLNFPCTGFEYEAQWVNRRLFVCCALLKSCTVPQPRLPFYLILPMTDCTLFKLPVTFPLRELLHFKILIKAEPVVTSWFPPTAEAAANIKRGVTSLRWGQGVKLDNRLFVCGVSLWFPDLSMGPKGCEPPGHQWLKTEAKAYEVTQQAFHRQPQKTVSWNYGCLFSDKQLHDCTSRI